MNLMYFKVFHQKNNNQHYHLNHLAVGVKVEMSQIYFKVYSLNHGMEKV
jgi:hypothetical protein